MDHHAEAYVRMLSEIEEMQTDVVRVGPAIQRILENFESTLVSASKIISEQDEKIQVLGHREYVGQMVLLGGCTLAYLIGLWGGGYACAK